jgi:hypothetical protein
MQTISLSLLHRTTISKKNCLAYYGLLPLYGLPVVGKLCGPLTISPGANVIKLFLSVIYGFS